MMTRDTAETPLRIGARNPFVYAEHKLGKKINWHKMSPGHKREKLEEAFGMPYNQLFDPKNESPLFVKTGDLRACTTVSNPNWAPNPAGSTYTVTSRAYNDLVQGDLPDCFFIAALSSVAFAAPALIPNKLGTSYTYYFFNPPAVMGDLPIRDAPITVTNKLPLDPSTGNYRYSKSFTAGEIWIAMYEKAFAAWKNRSKGDTPDYSLICTGDPVLALMNITGWRFSTTSKYSTQDFSSGTLIYSKIRSACKSANGYWVAQFPMVAYTYDPRIESPPSGITYNNATIVGNHSYSVLGVHTIGTTNYIVMRNPWGQKGSGPGSGDPDPTNLPAGALATGKWSLITELSDPNDAIFALEAGVFRNYFKGFGWVSL